MTHETCVTVILRLEEKNAKGKTDTDGVVGVLTVTTPPGHGLRVSPVTV